MNEYDYIYQDPERYRNMTDEERDTVSRIGCISAIGEIVVIMALIGAAALFFLMFSTCLKLFFL